MRIATVRGIFVGAIVGLGVGGLTFALFLVRGTIAMTAAGDGTDPVDKSRLLANAIAEGMHLGFLIGLLAPAITIPLAISWSRRRERSERNEGGAPSTAEPPRP